MKQVLYLAFLFLILLPGFAQKTNKFIWGIWYNSYQKPYITFQEKYDSILFIEHLEQFQKMGINRIYFLVKFPTGHVFYDSKIAPKYPGLDWDPLAFLVKECHNRQIELFPYINIFPEGEYNEITKEHDIIGPYLEKFPHHAMLSQEGKIYGWASPAVKEAVEYELSILEEIVKNYDIDGIQFDRIRYPDNKVDYHPECVAQYQKIYQKLPTQEDYTWTLFRQELLTNFVKQARAKILAIKPNIPISVAVFPRPQAAPINELQAWSKWCKEGLLDEVNPMSYYRNIELFEKYVQYELEVTPADLPFLSGIGAHIIPDPDIMEKQIDFALSRAVQGIVFFNGYFLLEPEKIKVLQKYTIK